MTWLPSAGAASAVRALTAPAPAAPKLLALSNSLTALAYLADEIIFIVLVIFWILVTDLIRMPNSFSLPDECLTGVVPARVKARACLWNIFFDFSGTDLGFKIKKSVSS